MIFNSFLYSTHVWLYGVLWPHIALIPKETEDTYDRLVNRFLFLIWVLGLYSVLVLGHWVYRKKIKASPDGPWWQISMGGLIGLCVLMGTLVGVVGRLIVMAGQPN